MPSALQLAFTRGCLSRTLATSATIKSVWVRRRPGVCFWAMATGSRAALSAPASTSRVTKKCGTDVQLWVVRSAMRRPIEPGTSICAAVWADDGGEGAEVEARGALHA